MLGGSLVGVGGKEKAYMEGTALVKGVGQGLQQRVCSSDGIKCYVDRCWRRGKWKEEREREVHLKTLSCFARSNDKL